MPHKNCIAFEVMLIANFPIAVDTQTLCMATCKSSHLDHSRAVSHRNFVSKSIMAGKSKNQINWIYRRGCGGCTLQQMYFYSRTGGHISVGGSPWARDLPRLQWQVLFAFYFAICIWFCCIFLLFFNSWGQQYVAYSIFFPARYLFHSVVFIFVFVFYLSQLYFSAIAIWT